MLKLEITLLLCYISINSHTGKCGQNVTIRMTIPRRVPMDKIQGIYRKIRKDKRLLSATVAVLSACLLGVVALFVFMPEIQAATNEVTWTPTTTDTYSLANLQDGDSSNITTTTLNVDSGNTYTILGNGTAKTNVSIKFHYTGTAGDESNPAKVYVVLDNVHIGQTLDVSAFEFTTAGSPVDFVVTVKGDCSITSTCAGATSPLMAVENTSYEFYVIQKNTNAKNTAADYVETVTEKKQVGIVLQGATVDATLQMSNGAGSFAALVGSSESTSFATASAQEVTALITAMNADLMLNNPDVVTVSNSSIIAALRAKPYNFTYDSSSNGFQPQCSYKKTSEVAESGKIVIGGENGDYPLTINVTNAGYGAAFGGGGSQSADSKGANAGKITINAGTITVNTPATDYNSPVFGSGIAKGASSSESTYGSVRRVEINGGSIWFGSHTNKFGQSIPVNSDGDQVFEITVNTKADNVNSITDLATLSTGTSLSLAFDYDSALRFDFDLKDRTTNRVETATGSTGADVNYLDVNVTLKSVYNYKGTGHGASNDMLGFWLPATQMTTLVIKDDFGPGTVKFTVKGQNGEVDETSEGSRTYELVRGKIYYISAEDIPAGLYINTVTVNTASGNSYNASYDSDGCKVKASDESMTATFKYSGSIDIVYDAGLVSGDESNHDLTGVMPTEDYEYGTASLELKDLGTVYKNSTVGGLVTDLIFKGWVYIDNDGNERDITHITKDTQADGNKRVYTDIMQSDGKIHLKAKWAVKTEYVIGDDATLTDGAIAVAEVEYAYGTGYVMDVTISEKVPQKESFEFTGWSLDDDTALYIYDTSLGAINTVSLSTLTSHVFYANYERTGFSVYVDALKLNEDYAILSCIGENGADILIKNADGSLATVVIDGKTYYYTDIVKKATQVRVSIKTKLGYKMENTSINIKGSVSNNVTTDSVTGECLADIVIEDTDVYVSTDAVFSPVEYEISFKDGKEPNELLWSDVKFTYTVEDIASKKTIGDIIREGLNKSVSEMSDSAIAAYINTISKNTRFTDYTGWNLPLYADVLPMNKTIASIFEENTNLSYGDLVFTANWTAYDKFAIDVNLLEREFNSDGTYTDKATDKLKAVLYYYVDSSTKVPVYTEEITDDVTGEEKTVAYAKAGDKIEVSLYRVNSNGKIVGDPVAEGINIEQFYYEYESKLVEDVHAEIKDGSQNFTIKDDVKDDTVIEVYMVFSAKKFNIVYWDLRGYDNSANPTTYTIFDEIEFEPLVAGVDWLLVCPDTDDTNYDDVTTEVICRIDQNGKLVTDGNAGSRDYIANLILKPDWADYSEDSYNISIRLETTAFGNVSIVYPSSSTGFYANDMIILSVTPKEGYKLVSQSLTYKKDSTSTYSLTNRRQIVQKAADTVIITPVDEENGTYIFTMPASDIVISASFELCQYKITYSDMADGVINPNPDSYNINSEIVLAAASRQGYKFLGWYDASGNKIVKISGRTGDIVLTPKFELDSDYVNTDDDNSGSTGSGSGSTGTSSGSNDGGSVTGRPSNVVSRPSDSVTINDKPTGVQTGDETNVPRLALICVAAVLVLMIVVLKRPNNKEDDE